MDEGRVKEGGPQTNFRLHTLKLSSNNSIGAVVHIQIAFFGRTLKLQ